VRAAVYVQTKTYSFNDSARNGVVRASGMDSQRAELVDRGGRTRGCIDWLLGDGHVGNADARSYFVARRKVDLVVSGR